MHRERRTRDDDEAGSQREETRLSHHLVRSVTRPSVKFTQRSASDSLIRSIALLLLWASGSCRATGTLADGVVDLEALNLRSFHSQAFRVHQSLGLQLILVRAHNRFIAYAELNSELKTTAAY